MARLINVYGGPGAGKTTVASTIFAHLKQTGRHAELCLEFAKELVYAGVLESTHEHVIWTEQTRRQQLLLKGGVDIVVTDAPLLHKSSFFEDVVFRRHYIKLALAFEEQYEDVLHIVLPEPTHNSMRGRVHNLRQSKRIHHKTVASLEESNLAFWYADGVPQALEHVFNFLLRRP